MSTSPASSEDDGRKHVVGSARHRNDVRLDDSRSERLQGTVDGGEDAERGRAWLVQWRRRRCERSVSGKLPGEHAASVVARQVEIAERQLAESVHQLSDRLVLGCGVLADFHGGQLQAERADGPDCRG